MFRKRKFVSGKQKCFDPRQKKSLIFEQRNMSPARLNLETFPSAKDVVYCEIDVQTSEECDMMIRNDCKRKSAKRYKVFSTCLEVSLLLCACVTLYDVA